MSTYETRGQGFAAIAAVARCAQALQQTAERRASLPGFVVFHGLAGLGKTTAAATVAARFAAAHLECRSMWTRKDLAVKLAHELRVEHRGTLVSIAEGCAQELAVSGKAVILDDFDNIVAREGLVELVRDLYEMSGAPMLIIGEERLPKKLERYERVHSRVLAFVPAPFADVADARALAAIYAPGVAFGDDALGHLVEQTGGSVRRIAVTLELWSGVAGERGLDEAGLAAVRSWPISTGRSPEPRR